MLVRQTHCPVGAYEILSKLTQDESKSAQPPTVYRALDFLQEQELVHRLSSINACVGCSHPNAALHSSYFSSAPNAGQPLRLNTMISKIHKKLC